LRHKLLAPFSAVSPEGFLGLVESEDVSLLIQKKETAIWTDNQESVA